MKVRVIETLGLTHSSYKVIYNQISVKCYSIKMDYKEWDKVTQNRQFYELRKRRDRVYENLKYFKDLASHILTEDEALNFIPSGSLI